MERRLVVSTECPTCAAPLDFTEGSNAVHCGYCRSNLLVTGRKQVLSYYIEPKVAPRDAAQAAWHACREKGWRCRAVRWERYFIPYYRLTGHDLRWERAQPERKPDPVRHADLRREFALMEFQRVVGLARSLPRALTSLADSQATGKLRDRYVDKNFVACDLKGAALYSLGVRLGVLHLHLFRRDVLQSLGHIVAADLTPQAALSQGMQTVAVATSILQRKVLGRSLSMVYYPFCVVEIERGKESLLGIVDGVSGKVVKLDAPLDIYEALTRESTAKPQSAGFRPLVCPNCGWNLPVNPDHVIFYCTSCEQAWQIHGTELLRVHHQTCEVSDATEMQRPGPLKHLPFWVLENANGEKHPPRFFVPAFRYRRLKILVDLARDMSGRERCYSVCRMAQTDLHGCYYDQEDAVRLAEITYPGLTSTPERTIEQLQKDPMSFSAATLTWFPFRVEGRSLRDPFTQRVISERLLS